MTKQSGTILSISFTMFHIQFHELNLEFALNSVFSNNCVMGQFVRIIDSSRYFSNLMLEMHKRKSCSGFGSFLICLWLTHTWPQNLNYKKQTQFMPTSAGFFFRHSETNSFIGLEKWSSSCMWKSRTINDWKNYRGSIMFALRRIP